MLSLILALLGFGSCNGEPGMGMIMYGMPPVGYDVKTRVLDEENKPIRGIRVDVKSEEHGNHSITNGLTDANGVFEDGVYERLVNIVFEDVDGDAGGLFEKDSIQANLSGHSGFTVKLRQKD